MRTVPVALSWSREEVMITVLYGGSSVWSVRIEMDLRSES